ncbi:ImmA/IrrE family metallo-endopeptidase [Pseudomonas viridiflava]|uniref:ImmA/IrrE family metallo-endopeptidase n=1 Tax=Pseudomonas viridiflava TaxID=33069 RepID=UPI0018E60575|nr:ImmA/IrrE family metallo-endopeptidase [Pseudomonas viridiflava]MBI6703294.1 ImmA/IrrE family metallo-endopeptidase [Pseudomonas viridiflava]MBI6725346.1 ImmA/IrrE family metallo-endopeptidase [Pseudomonas viridiflava]
MKMMNSLVFQPTWVSPPGETILDILYDRQISPESLAEHIGYDAKNISALFNGREEISERLAQRLAAAIGPDAEFWLNREKQYRDDVSRIYRNTSKAEDNWLAELPIKSMQSFGWIPTSDSKSKKVIDCLDYFGISDISAWKDVSAEFTKEVRFRTSQTFDQEVGATAAWVRFGETKATKTMCKSWDKNQLLSSIDAIKSLTLLSEPRSFIPELQQILSNCGVVLIISKTPEGCPVSGMAKFVTPEKALIMLSFRYLSDDHFWFSLFHELGHLILHGQKSTFVEGEAFEQTKEEKEANEFAARTLIPMDFRKSMKANSADYRSILKFAKALGIAPGIVVGQMQHEGIIKAGHMNKLKVRYSWSSI